MITTAFNSIFRDKDGKIVIWQSPNLPLWGWIVSSLLGKVFTHGAVHAGFQHLAAASLFVWAYLEIRTGGSIFRRILGGIIMLGMVHRFFQS
jgi:hypothetical protein